MSKTMMGYVDDESVLLTLYLYCGLEHDCVANFQSVLS